MNSLRPLVTITILVVIGAFLYVKLNEGPGRNTPPTSEPWQLQPPTDVPPLNTGGATASTATEMAPPWPGTAATPQTSQNTVIAATEPTTQVATAPTVPALPDLPPTPSLTPADTSPVATAITPAQLPDHIPTAKYPDQLAATGATSPAQDATATTTTPSEKASADASAPAAPTVTTAEIPTTPESANAAAAAAMSTSSLPLAAQPNPLRERPAAEPVVDRYAAVTPTSPQSSAPDTSLAAATPPNTPAPVAPVTPIGASAPPAPETFATSWPVIQAALQRGELARAHELLSRWYGDPSLTPTDAERVQTLLSQLAGTVVYSTEHQLEPAYLVKPGDTLETIAAQYHVPWQLLAKINGIPSADAVRPGQELKVVRGPFSAIVDLDRKELVLMLDKRYAGKFAIAPPRDRQLGEGEWVVTGVSDLFQLGQRQRWIVLGRQDSASAPGQSSMVLTSVSPEQLRQQGVDFQEPLVGLSQTDAEDVADILSIGSRVIVRR